MDNSIDNLENVMSKRWELFKKIHKTFLSFADDVNFRIFPIYIVYSMGDRVFSVIYYKGKLIDQGYNNLIVSLALSATPKLKLFIKAAEIKYLGINYYINLKFTDKFDNKLISVIKKLL